MENPGQWSQYCYRKKFNPKWGKKYVHHYLPTGARPVTANKEEKRKCGDWEFHYAGWETTYKQHRWGATTINLLPEEIRGESDEDVLTKLVFKTDQMKTCEALFFFQVLWPMCHSSKSDIVNDPRVLYFTSVE